MGGLDKTNDFKNYFLTIEEKFNIFQIFPFFVADSS